MRVHVGRGGRRRHHGDLFGGSPDGGRGVHRLLGAGLYGFGPRAGDPPLFLHRANRDALRHPATDSVVDLRLQRWSTLLGVHRGGPVGKIGRADGESRVVVHGSVCHAPGPLGESRSRARIHPGMVGREIPSRDLSRDAEASNLRRAGHGSRRDGRIGASPRPGVLCGCGAPGRWPPAPSCPPSANGVGPPGGLSGGADVGRAQRRNSWWRAPCSHIEPGVAGRSASARGHPGCGSILGVGGSVLRHESRSPWGRGHSFRIRGTSGSLPPPAPPPR